MREKNKFISKSISWSLKTNYAIKKITVKSSQVEGEGGSKIGLDFFPSLTLFFLRASLNYFVLKWAFKLLATENV